MVRSDPHGNAIFLATENQGPKTVGDPGQLIGIFEIRILPNFELFLVRIVSGIDANFFNRLGGDHRCVGGEVDIRN